MTTTPDAEADAQPLAFGTRTAPATTTARLLLTVEAAAERLSISRTRAYALIKTGDLYSVRVGRLRRVPVEALTEFTAELRRRAGEHPPDAQLESAPVVSREDSR